MLDAIYILAMTRSNFTISDQQLVKDDANFFRLESVFNKTNEKIALDYKLAKGKRKVIEKNGKILARSLDHIGEIPIVMITPGEINLVTGGNAERRKLADATLSQTDRKYLENLVVYNRLLKQRNALLKEGLLSGDKNQDLLDAYDQKMSGPAQKIYASRENFFLWIKERATEYYRQLCANEEMVDINYVSQLSDKTFDGLAAENRHKDMATGRTHAGIHRDSVTTLIENRDARIFASQGQKKSLVFALKLAQTDFLCKAKPDLPMLLLDDVFDRLDEDRVDRLLDLVISGNFGQIFITDTQWDRLEHRILKYGVPHQKIEITNGKK